MSNNNLPTSSMSENAVINESGEIFKRGFTTSDYYKMLKEQSYGESEAIKEVCKSVDCFCTQTSNNEYLIERYTELYNHNNIIKPLALSLITVLVTVLVNLGVNALTNTINAPTSGSMLGQFLGIFLGPLLLVMVFCLSLRKAFIEFKKTYSPYDIFILPYERERIHKELIKRGYLSDNIIDNV